MTQQRSVFLLFVPSVLVLQFGTIVSAHNLNDSTEVDEDFSIQGEYVGSTRLNDQTLKVGMQLIAMGGGRFDAVMYEGGLPGAGWNQHQKWSFKGGRMDKTVELKNEQNRLVLKTAGEASKWTVSVHDADGQEVGQLRRTQRVSPTMHAPPPAGAVVLFDGTLPINLTGADVTDDGLLNVGATTTDPVGSFQLHLEFRTPYLPEKRSQGRGNSGVYIQRRYEVQILDSFGLEGKPNECGGLYRQKSPDINMCLPPLLWQTYDIYFTAARFDETKNKLDNARITVIHNGVTIHNDVEIKTKTGAGKPEGPEKLPILFQDHGNPVHFRNMWIVHHVDELQGDIQQFVRQPTTCNTIQPRVGWRIRRLRNRLRR